MKQFIFFAVIFSATSLFAQSPVYKIKKEKQLAGPSPFQDEVDGKLPQRILYSDSLVLVLGGNSASSQAPVHLLLIPRRRISSLNAATENDAALLGHMLLVAKNMAKLQGISESGYRLVVNTNEDAGQSAFHIHMHLLGGTVTGAMVDQSWRNVQRAKTASTNKEYLTAITKDSLVMKLMGRWQFIAMEKGKEVNTVLQFEPELNYRFLKETYKNEVKDSTGKILRSYEASASFGPAGSQKYTGVWLDTEGHAENLEAAGTGNSFAAYIGNHELKFQCIFLNRDTIKLTVFTSGFESSVKDITLKRIY